MEQKINSNANISNSLSSLLLCLCFFVLITFASSSSLAEMYSPKSADLEEALTQSVVTSIVQDQQGFIWIGTEAGLNRYDGYSVEQFYSLNSELTSDNISALEVDSKGNLWVGTSDGLNVFLRDKGKFFSFYNNSTEPFSVAGDRILSLATDKTGGVWVGTTEGVSYYLDETQSFKNYPIINKVGIREPVEEISSIVLDENGQVFLATTAGKLAKFESEQGLFREITLPYDVGQIHQLEWLKSEELLLRTDQGILDWKQSEKQLQKFDLAKFGIEDTNFNYTNLLVDNETVWIGTQKNGAYSINLNNNKTNHYIYQSNKKEEVGANNIRVLFKGLNNVLWLGTDAFLHRINSFNVSFTYLYNQPGSPASLVGNSIFSLMVDSDGWLWAGTENNGFSVLKPTGTGYQTDPNIQFKQWNGAAFNGIVEASSDRIWLITAEELWSYDKLKKNFKQFIDVDFKGATLFSGFYRNGDLWISSSKGIWRINNDGSYEHILIEQQSHSHKNTIYKTLFDSNSNSLWLATEQGVLNYSLTDKTTKTAHQLIEDSPASLNQPIYDLHQDLHGRLWVGTYANGLLRLDFTTQKIDVINDKNSSLNNVVYSIAEDTNNYLWLATAQGLYRLDATDFTLAHFTVAQGQPISDFNLGAKEISAQGTIFLGGINGIISFEPKNYISDNQLAVPVITKVLINNRDAKIGTQEDAHSILPVNETNKLTISYEDVSTAIEFSGLHYANPKNNRFRYMLEGYDKDWVEVGFNGRRAVYAKLEPGQYRFRLMASNENGFWNPEPKDFEIIVTPSPYLSGWALLLYSILGVITLCIITYLAKTRRDERNAAQFKLEESEERLKLSLWGSGDELWDWDLQTGGLHLSNEWELDFPRDGIRSGYSDANSNIHPNDLSYVKQALNSHISGKSKHFESTYRLSDEKGGWIWVLDQGKSVEFDGVRPIRMAGTLKDITDIKDAEQSLSVIVKSFESIADAVWILDSDLNYLAINKAFERITGYSSENVIGSPMHEEAIKGMTSKFYNRLMKILEDKGSWQGELEAIRSDESIYPIEISIDVVRDNDGTISNYVGVFSDITYRKKAEKELRRLATTDQLTNLPNRSTFRAEVEAVLSQSQNGTQHALLFIDLDNFKRINDSLGHGVGDELLIEVANILEQIQEGNKGMVARLGGDEFIVFLEDVDAWNNPAKIAESILDRFGHTLKLASNELMVSPSIGIVMYPENGDDAEELLRNADTAMYYAKKKGKNTYQFYTRQMNEQAKMRLTLENDLRQAIEKDEFVVFYQPKVSLETGKITSLEALVRWRNEDRGLVFPNEFIPLAEESGLIIPISQQVIEKTCIQIRDWQKRGLFTGKIAINLSAVQFYHENLWETVKSALHLAKIEADSIEFEITEGMVMQDLAHSIQQMNTLKDMGVSLALDDFGVGYSSLGNLKDFPIDTLKIDRSFVWDLDDSERDRKLVSSIVTLAHNLDLKVVAEGVETIKQVEALKLMNCEEIQGFIFSKPVPAFKVEQLLKDPDANLAQAMTLAKEDEE